MYTDLEIISNIAQRLADLINRRALEADNTDFSDPEQVEALQALSAEVNEAFDLHEQYLGRIMAKQISKKS